MAWMRRQAGVEHLVDTWVLRQPQRDGVRVLAVLPHAYGERLDTAQHEPAVERAGHRAERLLPELQALRDRRVVRRGEAPDDVGVPAEVLGGGVHDDVGAELERPL